MTTTGSLMCSAPVVLTTADIQEGLYQVFREWGVPHDRAEALARQEHPMVADRINARSLRDGCRVAAIEE